MISLCQRWFGKKGILYGIIAGLAVLLAIFIVGGVVFCIMRQRRQRRQQNSNSSKFEFFKIWVFLFLKIQILRFKKNT